MINTTDLPAFPRDHANDGHNGMTLRDYFAAKAMQGFAANPTASWQNGVNGMARCAYEWADAMLKARES